MWGVDQYLRKLKATVRAVGRFHFSKNVEPQAAENLPGATAVNKCASSMSMAASDVDKDGPRFIAASWRSIDQVLIFLAGRTQN